MLLLSGNFIIRKGGEEIKIGYRAISVPDHVVGSHHRYNFDLDT